MDTGENPDLDAVAGLSSLDDPARRRLYEYVAANDEAVSRDEAAAAAGIGRSLAAYHLDKLAEAGLLNVSYARPPGRGGPGAGRPAKRYSRTQREVAVSVPPRNYRLLAGLLTEAVAKSAAGEESGTVRTAVAAAARRAGRAAGSGTDISDALRACGYEPAPIADGSIELRNCPFHHLAQAHTELVCGLNRQLVAGLLEAAGESPQRAVLVPRADRCCVVVRGSGGRRAGVLRRRGPTPAPQGDRDSGDGDG